ncbi:MAG: hypothetical protein K8S54_04085 [Spirochaetia bacterium]|nr:hypothetical protein [Spirochaetia bacterium]
MKEREELNRIIDGLQADSSFTERTRLHVVSRTRKSRAIKRIAGATAAAITVASSVFLFSNRVSDSQQNASMGISRAELATQTQTQMRWAQTDDVISSALANR